MVDGRWSSDVDGTGTLSGTFPLRSGEWQGAAGQTAIGKAFLGVSYVGEKTPEVMLEAGPIWTKSFDEESGMLTVGAAGLWSYFDRRRVMSVAGLADPAMDVLTLTGNQLGLIAKNLIATAQGHTGGSLPIYAISDASLGGIGTVHTRTYYGYELATIGERLRQLTEIASLGPEVQFQPRFSSTDGRYVQWLMRIGAAGMVYPYRLTQEAGQPWVFDYSVPKSPVSNINIETDGSKVTFRSWAQGAGDSEQRLTTYDEDLTLVNGNGFALLESLAPATNTDENTDILHAKSQSDLAVNARALDTWTLSVARDGSPNPGMYRVGDWCAVRTKNHVYIEDGDHVMRIVKVSGDQSAVVQLQAAPA